MAHIRKIADLKNITKAEQRLIDACKVGEPCDLGGLPEEGDKPREIRADLLRFLILGGCEKCVVSEGVTLAGAVITDELDLSWQKTKGQIHLSVCLFLADIELLQTRCDSLILHGSHVKSLNAQSIKVDGNVFLRAGFQAIGEVSLSGAQIGGQLDCSNGSFSNEGGHALNAQRMSVTNDILWRNVDIPEGAVVLNGAKVGGLADDLSSWPTGERIDMDGFDYARIAGSSTDADFRLEWLSRGDTWKGKFFPQPYVHLAKVLREMGHERDARKVLIAKEDLLSKDYEKRDRERRSELQSLQAESSNDGERQSLKAERSWIFIKMRITLFWRKILCRLVGYGHAPERAAKWSVYFIAGSTLFFWLVWSQGGLVPNSPLILNSPAWADALALQPESPSLLWVKGEIGQHYETFNPIAYASDIFIPLIELGQESAWTATTVTKLGTMAWVAAWVLKAFGWIVTALAAAAVTGIIKRE